MRIPVTIKEDRIEFKDSKDAIYFSQIQNTFFESNSSKGKTVNLALVKIKVLKNNASYSYGVILKTGHKIDLIKNERTTTNDKNILDAYKTELKEIQDFDKKLITTITHYSHSKSRP